VRPARHITPTPLVPSWHDCLARADDILSRPPASPYSRRVEPRGQCVARFVLPLEWCKSINRVRDAQRWQHARDKSRIRKTMQEQAMRQGLQRIAHPLPGRPQVHCVRFSTRAPDPCADWAKMPVDVLTPGHGGLGLLVDDDLKHCDLWTWWEPAKRGEGFVYVEVRA